MAPSRQLDFNGDRIVQRLPAVTKLLKRPWVQAATEVRHKLQTISSNSYIHPAKSSTTSTQNSQSSSLSVHFANTPMKLAHDRTADDPDAFWARKLNRASETNFPRYLTMCWPIRQAQHSRFIRIRGGEQPDIQIRTMIQAAWILINARFSGSSNIVFGVFIEAKEREGKGKELILATVIPLRIQLENLDVVKDLFNLVEHELQKVVKIPNIVLKDIQRLDQNNSDAYDSHNVLVIYCSDDSNESDWLPPITHDSQGSSHNSGPALLITYGLEKDYIRLDVSYDIKAMPQYSAERLAAQLEHILQQFYNANDTTKLDDIEIISPAEISKHGFMTGLF